MTPQRVDAIAQGRVWDGGTARQLHLVDRFGTLQDAVGEAAKRAKLDPAKVHAEYLEKERASRHSSPRASPIATTTTRPSRPAATSSRGSRRSGAGCSPRRSATCAAGERRIGPGACLECGGLGPSDSGAADARLLDLILAASGCR